MVDLSLCVLLYIDHRVVLDFPSGVGPIFLSSMDCSGGESYLLECSSYDARGVHTCSHSDDVGVRCECKCAS